MVADLADSRGRERNFLQQMLWTPRGPHLLHIRVQALSAPRPSLGAWAPKPITVNHRSRQFFARACNREGVINPSNSVERSLRGTQDVTMLGGVVALERVDDNVCHWRAPGSGDL